MAMLDLDSRRRLTANHPHALALVAAWALEPGTGLPHGRSRPVLPEAGTGAMLQAQLQHAHSIAAQGNSTATTKRVAETGCFGH